MADQNISQLTAQTGAAVDRVNDLLVIWDDSASSAARTKKITLPELEIALTGLQPIDADITAIAALSTTGFIERTGAGTATTFTATTFGKSLIDDLDAATARGTLGLVIGTDVQAYNLRLADIATNLSATTGAIEKTGANTFGTFTVSTYGKSLIDDADQATARTTLGLVPGSDVQPYNDRLTALANISATTGTFEKTGLNTVGVYTVSSFAKTFLDDADQAAVQGTLGLTPGTNVQAYSDRLADIVSGFAGATNGQFLRKNAGGTALEYATVSGTGTVSSVALTAPSNVFNVTGTPITSAGTLAIAFRTDIAANQFLASPNGSAGALAPRTIAAADLPDLSGTYQTLDVDLTAVANLSTTGLIKRTGSGSAATITSTTFTESLLDDADAATARTTLGVAIGTDVQAYSARLAEIVSGFAAASNGQVVRKNSGGTALEYATVSGGSSSPNAISFSNADRTITSGECTGANLIVRQTGTLSAARTLTLPAASAVSAGYAIDVTDESGTPAWWYPINITPAGSDTINGYGSSVPLPMVLPYGRIRLISNGSNGWSANGETSGNRDLVLFNDDFPYGGGQATGQLLGSGFVVQNSGSGSTVNSTLYTDAYGVYRFTTGTTATGYGGVNTRSIASSTSPVVFGNGIWRCEARIQLSAVPDGTDNFTIEVGFGDVSALESSNGAYWYILRSTSPTNWLAAAAAGGSRSRVDTGIAFASGSWIKLGVEVSANAGTGNYFLNGTRVTSPPTTNIPSGTSQMSGFKAQIVKNLGTTARFLDVDYFRALYLPTTPR